MRNWGIEDWKWKVQVQARINTAATRSVAPMEYRLYFYCCFLFTALNLVPTLSLIKKKPAVRIFLFSATSTALPNGKPSCLRHWFTLTE